MTKTIIFQIVCCILIGYLIGGINPAYIVSKLKGFDVRTQGSGNAGASNALITMGKGAGAFCALFDIFKGILAVKLGIRLFPMLKIAGILTGSLCIIGHIFPAYMGFKGGKGLATLGGVVLMQDIRIVLIMVFFSFIIIWIFDYICFVSVGGAVIFSIILAINHGLGYFICFLPVDIAMVICHKENFRRIKYGVEAKVSYLWRMNEETERLQNNWDNLTEEKRKSFEKNAYVSMIRK